MNIKQNWESIRAHLRSSFSTNLHVSIVSIGSDLPNPVKSILNIQSKIPILKVKIFDLEEGIVLNSKDSKIDCRSLLGGLYFIEVKTSIGLKKLQFTKTD